MFPVESPDAALFIWLCVLQIEMEFSSDTDTLVQEYLVRLRTAFGVERRREEEGENLVVQILSEVEPEDRVKIWIKFWSTCPHVYPASGTDEHEVNKIIAQLLKTTEFLIRSATDQQQLIDLFSARCASQNDTGLTLLQATALGTLDPVDTYICPLITHRLCYNIQ